MGAVSTYISAVFAAEGMVSVMPPAVSSTVRAL